MLNAGVYESALLDSEVAMLQFSALKDSATCSRCRSLDGTIRPKDDYSFWGFYTPPIHPRCRCSVVPVKGSEQQPTDKEVVDKLLDSIGQGMPPGFGGYDPKYEIGAR